MAALRRDRLPLLGTAEPTSGTPLRSCPTQDNPDTELLIRYFKIRQLWEDHKTSALTRPDRQLLRDGDRRFHSQVFEDAYRQWAAAKLSQTDLNDVLGRAKAQESRLFSTCVLSNDYDIFERLSKDYSADQAGAISRNRSSMGHHALQSACAGWFAKQRVVHSFSQT